jgi:hypothetical protein
MSQPPIVSLKGEMASFDCWTLAWQFSKNYTDWILASPFIRSRMGWRFEGKRWPFLLLDGKSR